MRYLPALVGLLIVGSSGLVHGLLTDRWRPSTAVRDAVAALDRVPREVGGWRSRDLVMDPAQLAIAGAAGYLYRRYEDRRTGATVDLLVLCGRPGPISLHPPQVCYGGRGYEMVRPPARQVIPVGPGAAPAEFRVGDLLKPDAVTPDRLRIFWAWKSAGAWQVPADPRMTFAPSPFLYKLYAVHGTASDDEPLATDAGVELLRRFLPELERTLVSGGPVVPRGGPA